MTSLELEVHCGLLEDLYGLEYISDYEVLQELLETEFDIEMSIDELRKLTKLRYEEEDRQLMMIHCGINY